MPSDQVRAKTQLRRWLTWASVAGLVAVAVVVAAVRGLGREPTQEPRSVGSPSESPQGSGAGPSAIVNAGPVVRGGSGSLAWELDLTEVIEGPSPWVTTLVEGPSTEQGRNWLVGVSVGEPGSSETRPVFLAINAATGQVVAPPVPTGLGEPMACAGELLEGRAVCALDGEIRLVDPSSAEVSPEPLIEDAGISAFTVFVEADRVLVAGLSVRDGSAQVAAFSPDGEELWASPLAVEGCPLATAADASFISLAHDTLRIGLGQVQALLEPGSGRSLMSACGQMGLAADGAVGLMPDEPGAATPVADTYTDARGTQHRICDFGAAGDVLPVELGSTAYFGVIGDDQLVRLFEAADCRQVWSQKDKPGQSIFQGYDSGSLYFSSVRGLTAIAVDSGGERWIARAGGGVAFRSSFVEDGWVVMITDESVIGLDPGTGEAAWTIDGFSQGAWYWVANRDGERQPLALLGPDRSHLARLDLDPLP